MESISDLKLELCRKIGDGDISLSEKNTAWVMSAIDRAFVAGRMAERVEIVKTIRDYQGRA